jgi:vacuolar-type H+-ATPase subunit H
MKEMVERILKEEEAVRRQVDEANLEAKRMIAAAKFEAETILSEALAAAQEAGRQKIERAEKDFLAQKEEILIEAKKEAQRLSAASQDKAAAIAGEVFRKYAF